MIIVKSAVIASRAHFRLIREQLGSSMYNDRNYLMGRVYLQQELNITQEGYRG